LDSVQTCLYTSGNIIGKEKIMEKKTIACANIVPGCSFQAEADSENELLQKVASHAAESHGVKEITPDLLVKVKSAIKTEE
jgi:predicted small metal-binding protein